MSVDFDWDFFVSENFMYFHMFQVIFLIFAIQIPKIFSTVDTKITIDLVFSSHFISSEQQWRLQNELYPLNKDFV